MPAQSKDSDEASLEVTAQLLQALNHPLRRRILQHLLAQPAALTPRLVSSELDGEFSSVSYHFRILRELDVVRIVRTELRRGATEHFYRPHPALTESDWLKIALEAMSADDSVFLTRARRKSQRKARKGKRGATRS